MSPAVLRRPEAYRQSLIAAFDSCPLRARFSLEDTRRTPGVLAARGSLLHRALHRAVRTMLEHGERTMSIEQGMELLTDVLCQHDVPSEEVIPLTMREMRWCRVQMTKWCEATSLDTRRVYATEKRLDADLILPLPIPKTVTITGQMDLVLTDPPDGMVVVDWKAQPVDAKVLTPLGWREIGSLREGDFVIGSDGTPTRVLGVYPQGRKEVYEIELTDGARTRSCDEHLWTVERNPKAKRFVRSLAEIRTGKCFRSWQVPAVAPIRFGPEPSLPLDPYLLGALLGDGNLRDHATIRFAVAEKEVYESVATSLPSGIRAQKWDGQGCELVPEGPPRVGRHAVPFLSSVRSGQSSYGSICPRCTGTKNRRSHLCRDCRKVINAGPLRRALQELGLLGKLSWEKFVPDSYLYASVDQRLALLQGLMDTDGGISALNQISFRSSSRQLAEDVLFLVRSLGGRGAICTFPIPGYRDSHAVQFRLDLVPFRLTRKVERWRPSKRRMGRGFRTIRSVGTADCVCIRVEAGDGLYVTDDFILTHNTGFRRPKQLRAKTPEQLAKAEEEGRGLTELGWVQNLIYSYLLFENFPSIDYVIFREEHVLWGEKRQAKTMRWQMERLKDVLADQVALLEQALEEGPHSPRWVPSAGSHCALCARPWDCPIMELDGLDLASEEGRRRVAHEWIVADEAKDRRREILNGLVERYGPIEVRHSEGRRVVGWQYLPDSSRRFTVFEPPDIPSPYDDALAQAARDAGVLEE